MTPHSGVEYNYRYDLMTYYSVKYYKIHNNSWSVYIITPYILGPLSRSMLCHLHEDLLNKIPLLDAILLPQLIRLYSYSFTVYIQSIFTGS